MNVIKIRRYGNVPFNSEDGTGSNRVGWKKIDKKEKIYMIYRDVNF